MQYNLAVQPDILSIWRPENDSATGDNNKWKNHFYEVKGDVGMSVHEKERKQEDAYIKT